MLRSSPQAIAGLPVGTGAGESRNCTAPPPCAKIAVALSAVTISSRMRTSRFVDDCISISGYILAPRYSMRHKVIFAIAAVAAFSTAGFAQDGPYKILKSVKAGGMGGFDYVYADAAVRRLYSPCTGNPARITVFNLDTLESVGEITGANARGVAVSAKTGHGFASSKPLTMFDTKTLEVIKKIDVEGGPDGIMYDSFNDRIWVFSHSMPHATIVNAADGSIAGTIADLGGAPEQAASD